jgi:dCTP deaminase
MILSDVTIREYLEEGKIRVLPSFNTQDIRPVGIRLHLGKDLLVAEPGQTIDVSGSDTVEYQKIEMDEHGYTLKAGQFVLGSTLEKFQVPRDIVCHIDGRSTLGRLGLSIHCTATIVDGNFDEARTVVLEMKNIGQCDLIIKPGIAIAMLTFSQLSTPIGQDSQVQYRGQDGVVAPNLKAQKK